MFTVGVTGVKLSYMWNCDCMLWSWLYVKFSCSIYRLYERLLQLYLDRDLNPESYNQRQISCTIGVFIVSASLSTFISEYLEW